MRTPVCSAGSSVNRVLPRGNRCLARGLEAMEPEGSSAPAADASIARAEAAPSTACANAELTALIPQYWPSDIAKRQWDEGAKG